MPGYLGPWHIGLNMPGYQGHRPKNALNSILLNYDTPELKEGGRETIAKAIKANLQFSKCYKNDNFNFGPTQKMSRFKLT